MLSTNSSYSSPCLKSCEEGGRLPLALASGLSATTIARAIKAITGGRNTHRTLTVLEK